MREYASSACDNAFEVYRIIICYSTVMRDLIDIYI